MDQCVDSSFIYSIFWSIILVLAIAKLRSDNYMRPFLMELYSPPILLAFIIAMVFTYFFYESLPETERQTIGTLFSRLTNIIQKFICTFHTTFNILGLILPFITIYTFLEKNHPQIIRSAKNRIKDLFM